MRNGYLTVREAAEALGWSQTKVRQEFHAGRLAGMRGPQRQRRRILIRCDDRGRPLDANGQPVLGQSFRARLEALDERVRAVEGHVGTSLEVERLRDASILQQAVIERQQRALDGHAKASQELSEVLLEQSRIISTLLVGDPSELAQSSSTQIEGDA